MTNSIGTGTCNVPVNMLEDERAILGRLAFKRDCSTGEFIRRLIRRGLALSHPDEAKQLAEIRRARRALTLSALLVASLFFSETQLPRATRVRNQNSIRRFELSIG